MTRSRMRSIFKLGCIVGLVLAGWAIEQGRTATAQNPILHIGFPFLEGAYDREMASTIPGANGPLNRSYRWFNQQATLKLAPNPGTALLTIEYLHPEQAGTVMVALAAQNTLAIPPTATLRQVQIYVPSNANTLLMFTQSQPISVEGRTLGLLVSAINWTPLDRGFRRVLFGLPLTIILWLFLLGVLRSVTPLMVGVSWAGLGVSAWLHSRAWWEFASAQTVVQGLLLGSSMAGLLWEILARRRPIRWGWVLIIVWGLTWLMFFTPNISHDGTEYYAYVRSLFIDGDLDFSNDLDPTQSPFAGTPNLVAFPTSIGRTPNLASVGPALVWTPFWLLAHGISSLGRAVGLNSQANGYDQPYIVAIALASALASLALLFGCWTLARRWFSSGLAALAALTVYLGGNLLFYAQIEGSFAHSLSAATATWFVVSVMNINDQPTLRRWVWLGIATGLMIVMYWITALLLIMPLLVGARWLFHSSRTRDWAAIRRLLVGAIVAAVCALIVFIPQLVAWKIVYGGWLATPHGGDYITPKQLHVWEILFAPLYGLAWWTPAFFIGLLGVGLFVYQYRWSGVVVVAGAVVYFLYNASLTRWFAGGSFGMRRLGVLAPVYTLGLATLFTRLQRFRSVAPIALAGAITAWGVAMTVRYTTFALSHDTSILQNTDLRAIILPPEPFPLASLGLIVERNWLATSFRPFPANPS